MRENERRKSATSQEQQRQRDKASVVGRQGPSVALRGTDTLRTKKAPRICGPVAEFLQETVIIPTDRKKGRIPNWKGKDDHMDYNVYRGITLLTLMMSTVDHVLALQDTDSSVNCSGASTRKSINFHYNITCKGWRSSGQKRVRPARVRGERMEAVERFDSPGRGRGLRVNRGFKVGELLFCCPPFASVLSVTERGGRCDFCFSRKEALARCKKCKKAFYCNVKCQKGDWAMHKLECSAMMAFGEKWCPPEATRLVARILAKKKTQKERCASEQILLVEELQSHVDDMDNDKRDLQEAHIAALHHFYSKHLEIPDHKDLLTLFSQVSCNGFTVEDDELSHMGTAIYPDAALINHSCLPNTIVTYNGTVAEVRAVQEVKPGDEVLISYIDVLYPTVDRNARLRESYFFTCECQECQTKSKDKEKLKTCKQSDLIEPKVISNMARYARNTIREFRAFKHKKSPSDLLEMCEQSLEKMGTVFDDSNVYMLHMMYQAMGVCLFMEDFHGAISYGEKIIKPYSRLYPPYSLNVSSMYLKLGRLYMGLDRRSAGLCALKKAMAIMEVAHGKDHHYLTELRNEMTQQN
ncbi:N-lysine methyltransferase SMYD2-B [Thalassophryne amazonica]|uniref:N-lysine methyltransferase SMYD2-B n=1 Tax=Thalassophryne amazonica TaxID=390379 RepID=UPI001471792E|nr:N-lysine methyltransferase SMYD2-B [Thalassophryne amazonica]